MYLGPFGICSAGWADGVVPRCGGGFFFVFCLRNCCSYDFHAVIEGSGQISVVVVLNAVHGVSLRVS